MNVNTVVKSILSRVAALGLMRQMFLRHPDGCATVFLLHRAARVYDGINGHDLREIENVLIELKKREFDLIPLSHVVEAAQGQRNLSNESIAFTMDDGYRDQIELIAPIFVKHQVPLTIFLTTGLINGDLWPWDAKINWLMMQARQTSLEIPFGRHRLTWPLGNQQERLHTRRELQSICAALPGEKIDWFLRILEAAVGVEIPQDPPPEFLSASWDQVRQLESSGVRFAPHTHTHRILSRLTEVEVCTELNLSLEIVLSETRHGLPILAYPVGMEPHFGLREMRLAKRMGFTAAFAVCEDYARWGESRVVFDLRYRLARYGFPHTSPEVLWFVNGFQKLKEHGTYFKLDQMVYLKDKCHTLKQQYRPSKMGRKAFLKRLVGKLQLAVGLFKGLKSIDLVRIERLVFVCRGNICRSPYAEAAANYIGISACSCGVDVRVSVPAETMAVHAALLKGKNLSEHMSVSIFDISLGRSDCLVVMDQSHLSVARDVATRFGCQITLLGLWRHISVPEIADPYGNSLNVFSQCFDDIDEALAGLMTKLQGEHAKLTERGLEIRSDA